MILITGGSGKTGRSVLKALKVRNASARMLVHREEQIVPLIQHGASQAVVGNLLNPNDMERAMQGINAIYHICPNVNPNEIEIGQIAISAAKKMGVTLFVYHSVLHPQTEGMQHHWLKLRVEEQLLESGLDFTILQPAAYMQNILGQWEKITKEGIYPVPYNIGTRLSMVDLENLAEVAAKVLVEPGHVNAIYEISGKEALSQVEVAAVLSKVTGKPVRAEQTPLDVWEERSRQAKLPEYALDTLLNMFRYYDHFGFCGNSNTLSWLLGRQPTTFEEFITRSLARGII